jgi:hypothetical protein
MSRLKLKALSNPPSQPRVEGGLDSARPLTTNTVASISFELLTLLSCPWVFDLSRTMKIESSWCFRHAFDW